MYSCMMHFHTSATNLTQISAKDLMNYEAFGRHLLRNPGDYAKPDT